MANFDILAEKGKPIFLRHDQRAMIRRLGLEADAGRIYVNFCGDRYAICRETADVTGPGGEPAGPAVTLSIFDMLCHTAAPCLLAHEWRTTNTLPGCGQSNPDDAVLNRRLTGRFGGNPEGVDRACAAMGGVRFPVGDIAWELPVFDRLPAVFQFWQGDDEFPSSVRFLWDRNTLQFLHYETTYYIMGHILQKIDRLL